MKTHSFLFAFLLIPGMVVSTLYSGLQANLPAALVRIIDTSAWNPPSPDPSGIAFLGSNRLIVVDSQVYKIPSLWQGKDVWITDPFGSVLSTCGATGSFMREPTGVSVNPVNGHLFFSTDNELRVYELNRGPDATFCTGDDTTSYFRTNAFGSNDPEDIVYVQGQLFIADGVSAKIYVVSPGTNGIFDGVPNTGDDTVTSFGTALFGINDPEGITYNSDHNTLLMVSYTDRIIAETTFTGTLVNTYSISFLFNQGYTVTPSGIAYGPGSSDPGVNHVYLTSRGVDELQDPDENDGKIFEIALDSTPATPFPTATASMTPTASRTPTATATFSGTIIPSATPTAISSTFPLTGVLDTFTRSDGPISSNWSGGTTGYKIVSNQLGVTTGGYIYWNPTSFDSNQEAFVTLVNIDPAATDINLLLKSQSTSTNKVALLEIWYNPVSQNIKVYTYTTATGWVKQGLTIPVSFANGDQLGARATANGLVYIYKNGNLVATRDITAWPYYGSNGYIGLFVLGSPNVILDNFGGGTSGQAGTSTATLTVTASNTPTPTFTRTPTSTSTFTALPTNTATKTVTPSATATNTTAPTATSTPSATATSTNLPTASATNTLVPTNTITSPPTSTFTATYTPSSTLTFTPTPTYTSTFTATTTFTPTLTFTPSATATATLPPSPTSTSTPSSFPLTGILDTFTIADGPIGSSWAGGPTGYKIVSNQLGVTTGGYIYWNTTSFEPNQEAYVTFVNIDTAATDINLLLKSQSTSATKVAMVEIWYSPANKAIKVYTYTTATGWVKRGGNIPMTFANGDQLGARATANGLVYIYKNGSLIATRDITAWPYYANGGYIGLVVLGSPNVILDNFGGGTP